MVKKKFASIDKGLEEVEESVTYATRFGKTQTQKKAILHKIDDIRRNCVKKSHSSGEALSCILDETENLIDTLKKSKP